MLFDYAYSFLVLIILIITFLILESFRPPKFLEGYDKNGFNLGCFRNIQQVFGKEIILWPLPLDTR